LLSKDHDAGCNVEARPFQVGNIAEPPIGAVGEQNLKGGRTLATMESFWRRENLLWEVLLLREGLRPGS
jgi:hypothetical protein